MKQLVRALRYFKPDGSRIAFVLVLLLLSVALNLLKPWPLAFIIDSLLLEDRPLPGWLAEIGAGWGKPAMIALLSVAVLILHLGHGALFATQNYLSIKIGLRGLTRVRNEVFSCLQRLSLRFHQGARAGDMIYRASWDTYAFQTLFQQGVMTSVAALLSLGLMIVIMSQINVPLTLLALATVPLLAIVIKVFGRAMTERAVLAQQADSQVTSMVQQNIAALPLIQSYTREETEAAQFKEKTFTAEQHRIRQHGAELWYGFSVAVVFGLGIAGITWLGAHQVMAERLTVGELIVFLAYLGQLYEPLNQLSRAGSTVAGASAGTKRIFEILDTPEEVKDRPAARAVVVGAESRIENREQQAATEPLIARGEISFENVSFSYRSSEPVLQDISFSVRAGESLAIIGPSGSGKTTLLSMVPRFFDPDSGAVRLDGADLRDLRLKDLRAQVALVLQEPILLCATVAENIAYGRRQSSAPEIEAAARAAFADEFIRRLPQGYETVLGEGAARLSVGEKQRINLARAFLKDAPILLLDEPTSALDAESEALVTASVSELLKGRTTFIVAHRFSTIQRADRILVLDRGRVAALGTPAEVAANPYFSRLVASTTQAS